MHRPTHIKQFEIARDNYSRGVKEYLPMHVIPEPRTCKKFGCGKVLSRQESLFGDTCIHCHGYKKVDVDDVMDDLDDLKFE